MPSAGTKRVEILAGLTILLCLGWATAGLAFRFTTYGSMPVAPGNPYGEADVMELLHYQLLLVLCGLALLEGVLLLMLRRFHLGPLGAFLCAFGVGLPFAYQAVHRWVAALAAR
jgi:hypothetical protein